MMFSVRITNEMYSDLLIESQKKNTTASKYVRDLIKAELDGKRELERFEELIKSILTTEQIVRLAIPESKKDDILGPLDENVAEKMAGILS